MKRCGMIWTLLTACLLVAATGCVSYPVSKALREQAIPVTLAEVQSNPGGYNGTMVIWGGRVIQTQNETNGASVYILKLPLTQDERPVLNVAPEGRFIVRTTKFIDPEVIKNGRLITVAGPITGVEIKPIQNVQYPYPVIAAQELHLWYFPPTPPPYPASWYWGYGPDGYWGWPGPGWELGFYGPPPVWGWHHRH